MSEIRGSVLVEVESAFYSFIIINRHLSRFFGFIRVFSVLMIWFTAMSHGSWQCNRKHYCKWITHSVDKKNQSAKQVGNVQFNLTLKWHVADKQSPIDKKRDINSAICYALCSMHMPGLKRIIMQSCTGFFLIIHNSRWSGVNRVGVGLKEWRGRREKKEANMWLLIYNAAKAMPEMIHSIATKKWKISIERDR